MSTVPEYIISPRSGHKIPIGLRAVAELDNAFAYVAGREFGQWIDYYDAAGTTRNTANGAANDPGYDAGDLIDCPPYIIESIFRDEVWVERDLQITVKSDTTHFTCTDVIVRTDDYYNSSIITNATTGAQTFVTDYTGSTAGFVISGADASMANGDNFYLSNIQAHNKVNLYSFDIIGNTTDGTRKDWVFGRSLLQRQPLQTIIDDLCYESHCALFERANEDYCYPQIKLIALDEASSGDTWAYPVISNGRPQIKLDFTSLSSVYTSFRLNYNYDYGKQSYAQTIFVDENNIPSTVTIIGDEEQNACGWAKATYRIENPFEYSSNWIYDDDTAEYFLQKKINWFAKQRLKVTWLTGISGHSTDWIKYERGDQVKLNYSSMIPSGVNNSHYFMITGKNIVTVQGAPYIRWQLIDMS